MIILNYLLYYGIILPLSWLPMRVLYVLSDVCYYIIYKGFKYRVPVVQSNMKRALPHLSLQELKATTGVVTALFFTTHRAFTRGSV